MRHHRTIAFLAVAALAGVAACGDDDTTADTAAAAPPTTITDTEPPDTTDATGTPDPTDATGTPDPTDSADVENGVLTIALSDFAFGGLPEVVPAGTKLAIENVSTDELHELVALRINDAETRSVDELLALPEEELLAAAGPLPATVLLAAPDEAQVAALGDGTLAEPGRYLVLCAIPTDVDPAEYLAAAAESVGPPDVPGGPPHFTHGMFAELIVE